MDCATPSGKHGLVPRTTGGGQLALFGVGRVPNLLTRDLRSVGELLADTDFQSRQLLLHLRPDDAPHLIVGWPQLLFAARDLWVELPRLPVSGAAAHQDRLIDRLVANGNGYVTDLARARQYLGDLEPDARLMEIADTFIRATKLVRRFGSEVDGTQEPARSDLVAAQTRLLHTLFLTVHAGYAATQNLRTAVLSRQLIVSEVIPGFRGSRLPRAVERLEYWANRLGTMEAAVARALNGRYPAAIAGEVIPPSDSVVRLPRALATWEIATHNHLAANPSNADIALIARGEGIIAAASRHILAAEQSLGLREIVEDCEQAATRWATIASLWRLLSPPASAAHHQLLTAAGELRAAIRCLTLDHAGLAQPALIVRHPGYHQAVQALLPALEDGRQIASIVCDFSHDPNLHGPARSLSREAQNMSEAAAGGDADIVWVSPTDTMTNKMIPVPRPILERLHADSAALELAAGILAATAAQAGKRTSTDLSEAHTTPVNATSDRSPEPGVVEAEDFGMWGP